MQIKIYKDIDIQNVNNFKHGTLNYDVVNVVEGVVFVVVIDDDLYWYEVVVVIVVVDDGDIHDDKNKDDLYRYEVVVVSAFLERLKNETALLRHKRLV